MASFDPGRDAALLRDYQAVIDELIAEFAEALTIAVPAVSGWSPEQHLAHVALANELVLRNVKSIAKGSGLLLVQGGEARPDVLRMLADGALPRGRAQAPRMVRPPERVERELLLQWLSDGRRELETLDATLLTPGELKVPHQLIGPLDAPQWMRFGAVHTRHHLAIVLEVLAQSAPGRALPAL
jgi:hypothetical protein